MNTILDPRYAQFLTQIENSVQAINSKRAYRTGLIQLFTYMQTTGVSRLTREVAQQYKAWLVNSGAAASTVNARLVVLRLFAKELMYSGLLGAFDALGIADVKGARKVGHRVGNWLTREQTMQLLAVPAAGTVKGKRDRAVLALFIGCGLRRDEVVRLRMADIQQRDGRWVIVDMKGKGGRVRTVPVPAAVKARVDEWRLCVGEPGPDRVFVPLRRGGVIAGESLSTMSLYHLVLGYAAAAGLGPVHPHDLRRTFARLTRKGGAVLDQIKETLGHSSVMTTEIYIGAQQDLRNAPGDLLDVWG